MGRLDRARATLEPFDEWTATRTTLHLYLQVVGKALLNLAIRRNHWWHSTFKITPLGLTSDSFLHDDRPVLFAFDLAGGRFRIVDAERPGLEFPLGDGLSVAEFYEQFVDLAARAGIAVLIDRPVPYDHPVTTPFPEDRQTAGYNQRLVMDYWRILVHSGAALEQFAAGFTGKRSPVQLFWHAMDLAVALYSGRRLPETPGMGTSARDAFSHETSGAGFKAGDAVFGFPYYFSYIFPADESVMEQPLEPKGAHWSNEGGMVRAILPYADARAAEKPNDDLLRFFVSAYEGSARIMGWDVDGLRYTWS